MVPLAGALLLGVARLCEGKVEYSLGAFYYGPWHKDPTNEKLHGVHAHLGSRVSCLLSTFLLVASLAVSIC